jgi:predicted DNA-binding protein
MRPVVVRFPGEDLSRLRILANSRGQTLSALLRDILKDYCRQLRENAL